jgi:hypothetical protein
MRAGIAVTVEVIAFLQHEIGQLRSAHAVQVVVKPSNTQSRHSFHIIRGSLLGRSMGSADRSLTVASDHAGAEYEDLKVSQ